MKIEVGKSYRTREGKKARIVSIDYKHETRPVVALVSVTKDIEHIYTYSSDGQILLAEDTSKQKPSDMDLASEWVEPLDAYAVIGVSGASYGLFTKERAESFAQSIDGRVVHLVEVID